MLVACGGGDMLAKLTEAKHLTERALALLDQIGEVRAAPHLDLALHELKQAMFEVSGDNGRTSALS